MGGPSETKGGKSSAAKKKKAAKKAKSAAESTSNDSPEGRAKQAAKECFVATTRVFRSFTGAYSCESALYGCLSFSPHRYRAV